MHTKQFFKARAFGFLLLASCAVTGSAVHDGAWWVSTSTERRLGYLAGYGDCALYDAHRSELSDVSWYLAEPEVTRYYRENPSGTRMPVGVVLLQVAARSQNPSRSGEAVSGKHGLFDGEYWRRIPGDQRLGFIEGYVDCRGAMAPLELLRTETVVEAGHERSGRVRRGGQQLPRFHDEGDEALREADEAGRFKANPTNASTNASRVAAYPGARADT